MEKKRVLAAGKFDILHLGHLSYLEEARKLAGPNGELIVIIARDDTITRERGAPPVFPQEQRRRLVEALDIVDKAIVGLQTDDHTLMVKDLKPDIIALGYDQRTDIQALETSFKERGVDTKILRLEKIDADGLCSSTLIRSRIIKFYRENGRPHED
ncbi:MAG: adenylyltransferase/cytidyltransferase family protein [Candidatus Thorarchaeota archaeon]|jgi:FAD synthetase